MTEPREFQIPVMVSDQEMTSLQQATPDMASVMLRAVEESNKEILKTHSWQCTTCRQPATNMMHRVFFYPTHHGIGAPVIFNATPWPVCSNPKCTKDMEPIACNVIKAIQKDHDTNQPHVQLRNTVTINYVVPLICDFVGHKQRDYVVLLTLHPEQAKDLAIDDSHAMQLVKRVGAQHLLEKEPWECLNCGKNGPTGVKATHITDCCLYFERGWGGIPTVVNHSAMPVCSDPYCIAEMEREIRRSKKHVLMEKCFECRSGRANDTATQNATEHLTPNQKIVASRKKKGKKKKSRS